VHKVLKFQAPIKRYIILIGLLISIDNFLTLEKVKASTQNKLMTSICLLNFNSEMNIAGKTPPQGMGVFTCNCFLKKVSIGSSIESAQAECKKEAAKKFKI
tara:strand:+ start:108 stop:410 length:303 start_codon:yes stop_codon:yes gene_type:complete